jgi:hypothetical protein
MRATSASHASHKREPCESCEPQARAMRATNASHASHCEPQARAMRVMLATNASQPLFILWPVYSIKKLTLIKKWFSSFLIFELLNYSPTCSHKARECTNTHSLRLVSTRSYGWNYYIENNTWAHPWDMFNTRNKSGISKHPCIFLFII